MTGVGPQTAESSAPKAPLHIVTLRPSDWGTLKMVRLRALKESQKQFAADYQTELALPRPVWQARLADSTWVIARSGLDHTPVGIAHLGPEPPDHVGPDPRQSVRYIESVWVDPHARERGVMRQMLKHLEAEARLQPGVRKLLLWVFEHNHTAWDAYLSIGFKPTGDEQPLLVAHGRTVLERRMVKALSADIEQTEGLDRGEAQTAQRSETPARLVQRLRDPLPV
jgi:GNAT superfamily N-acetyltransferase